MSSRTTPLPVFVALDTPDLARAVELARLLKGKIAGLKLGLEFYLAHGAQGYEAVAREGLSIFLDLKLHDIPNTVGGALSSLLPLKPSFMTIHTSGGVAMMKAAKKALDQTKGSHPKLLGVTILTSLDNEDLKSVGQEASSEKQVMRLASLAAESGLDGVICSPEEISALRKKLDPTFILMVPGIRPSWASAQDQKRVMTPKEALDRGATYLVIGRPITGAEKPLDAIEKIYDEIYSS